MSIAFSSSLLGLAGSLILGFIDINLGQAQNKFSLYFEKIMNKNSIVDINKSGDSFDEKAMQKIYDNLDNIVFSLKKTSENQKEINNYLSQLSEQINNTNNNSKSLDEKLSNFLSTQLNTQSSMLQLITKINDEGIFDSSTKKIFDDLNKNIQKLNSKIKK